MKGKTSFSPGLATIDSSVFHLILCFLYAFIAFCEPAYLSSGASSILKSMQPVEESGFEISNVGCAVQLTIAYSAIEGSTVQFCA